MLGLIEFILKLVSEPTCSRNICDIHEKNLGSYIPLLAHQNVLWGLEPRNLYFFKAPK